MSAFFAYSVTFAKFRRGGGIECFLPHSHHLLSGRAWFESVIFDGFFLQRFRLSSLIFAALQNGRKASFLKNKEEAFLLLFFPVDSHCFLY